jgi:hypothetical protein
MLGYTVKQHSGRQIFVVQPNLGVIDFDLPVDGIDQRREKLLGTQGSDSHGNIPIPFAQLSDVCHKALRYGHNNIFATQLSGTAGLSNSWVK